MGDKRTGESGHGADTLLASPKASEGGGEKEGEKKGEGEGEGMDSIAFLSVLLSSITDTHPDQWFSTNGSPPLWE